MNTKEKLARLAEAPGAEISIFFWNKYDREWTLKLLTQTEGMKVELQGKSADFDEAVSLTYDKFMNLGDVVTRELQAPMIEPPKAPKGTGIWPTPDDISDLPF